MTIEIRPYRPSDWPEIWAFMEGVFRSGDSYPNAIDTTEAQARTYWINAEKTIYVALSAQGPSKGEIVGTYYVRPNSIGIAGHVCNCGYMVSPKARGQGIATRLCEHSQDVARVQGYLAMQYNLVVSTNLAAVSLWQKLGFDIVGTLPKAFRHKTLGFVDAYVMYKWLNINGGSKNE